MDIGIDIKVGELARRADRTVHKITLPDIRGKEEQKEILIEALKDRGFEESENENELIRETEELTQIVNVEDLTLTTIVEMSEDLEMEAKVYVQGREDGQEQEEENLRKRLQEKASRVEEEFQRKINDILENATPDIKTEILDIVRDVYVESLKRHGETLAESEGGGGSVTSIDEGINNDGNFQVRIKGIINWRRRRNPVDYRRNPEFEIIFVENAKTRKKDIYIHIEKDPDDLPYEHNKKLKRIAKQLIGQGLIDAADVGDVVEINRIDSIPGSDMGRHGGHGHSHDHDHSHEQPKSQEPPTPTKRTLPPSQRYKRYKRYKKHRRNPSCGKCKNCGGCLG
jgi:ribosome-binding factor A